MAIYLNHSSTALRRQFQVNERARCTVYKSVYATVYGCLLLASMEKSLSGARSTVSLSISVSRMLFIQHVCCTVFASKFHFVSSAICTEMCKLHAPQYRSILSLSFETKTSITQNLSGTPNEIDFTFGLAFHYWEHRRAPYTKATMLSTISDSLMTTMLWATLVRWNSHFYFTFIANIAWTSSTIFVGDTKQPRYLC